MQKQHKKQQSASRINCTLTIDHITLFMQNNSSTKLSNIKIKNLSGFIFKQLPFQSAVGSITQILVSEKLQIVFSLECQQNGSKQLFAQGCLIVQQQINSEKTNQFNIAIYRKNTNIEIANIKITIKVDDEKISWKLAQQDEQESDQREESAVQRMTQKLPNRYQSVLRSKYKKNKGRRLDYQLRDQNSHANIEINNKITDNFNYILENFKLDCEQQLEYVKFNNKFNKQIIAQIFCSNSPTNQDLKKVRLKIPVSLEQLQVHVRTKDKLTYKTEVFFDHLNNDEVKAIGLSLKNSNSIKKSKFWFNYKIRRQDTQQSMNKVYKNYQKLESSPEPRIQQVNQQQKQPNSLRILQFLHSKNRKSMSSKRKVMTMKQLPQISSKSRIRNKQSITSMTVNEKILPFNKNSQTISNQDQMSPILKYNLYKDFSHQKPTRIAQPQSFIGVKLRSKTIENDHLNFKQYIVHISQVNVKFYTSYMTNKGINIERDLKIGKFLQIYSEQSQIYRSDHVYGSQALNWIIRSCQIKLNQLYELVIQICSTKQNKRLCKISIPCSELKRISEQNTFYKGHIMKNKEFIAKIIMEFRLKNFQQIRNSYLGPSLESRALKKTIEQEEDQYYGKNKSKLVYLHRGGGAQKYVYYRKPS